MIHFLIVGLGNPGTRYKDTRHNIGFRILDSFAESAGYIWSENKKYSESVKVLSDCKVHLLKPLEYMNLSGKAVQSITQLFKIPPENILVVQDEVDLPFGKIKNKIGGGTAGHNGLKDIVAKIGSSDFHRLRFGVGKPEKGGMEVADFVLQRFTTEEEKELPRLIQDSKSKVEEWIKTNLSLILRKSG